MRETETSAPSLGELNEADDAEIARILAIPDDEILAGATPEHLAALAAEPGRALREVRLTAVIRAALSDCSTTDWYDISDAGVTNLAGIAARAALAERGGSEHE